MMIAPLTQTDSIEPDEALHMAHQCHASLFSPSPLFGPDVILAARSCLAVAQLLPLAQCDCREKQTNGINGKG